MKNGKKVFFPKKKGVGFFSKMDIYKMPTLENYLFGPLDKSYCLLFYVFSIIAYFGFLGAVVALLITAFQGGLSKFSISSMIFMLYPLLVGLISYIQNRLLYSMCIGSNLKSS